MDRWIDGWTTSYYHSWIINCDETVSNHFLLLPGLTSCYQLLPYLLTKLLSAVIL